MLSPSKLFHVGVVVPNLTEAERELSAQGYTWAATMDSPVAVLDPAGTLVTTGSCLTYSREEPRIELIEARPGSPWTLQSVGAIHHLGYWVEALAPAMAAAAAAGWALEWHGADAEGRPARFAYYTIPGGSFRIELVDESAIGPALEKWWAGESYRR